MLHSIHWAGQRKIFNNFFFFYIYFHNLLHIRRTISVDVFFDVNDGLKRLSSEGTRTDVKMSDIT